MFHLHVTQMPTESLKVSLILLRGELYTLRIYEMFYIVCSIRAHMKKVHKIHSVVAIPVDPLKKDLNKDYFILRPPPDGTKSAAPQVNVDKTPLPEDNDMKLKYLPTEAEELPRSAIFSRNLQCALCSYSSKVRMNLVRHFQFHAASTEVPTSAPVNPVPCLEKNEKMFDKMTNLASSSHPIGRMSGTNIITKRLSQDDDDTPAFVEQTKR